MSDVGTLAVRRWHGLDDGVIAYGLAALRSLWVWPVLHMLAYELFTDRAELLGPVTVLALVAGGTLCAQCAVLLLKPGRGTQLLMASAGLVAVVLVLYLAVGRSQAPLWDLRWLAAVVASPGRSAFALLAAVALWWWGLLTGRDRVYHDSLVRNFTVGLAALLLLLALGASGGILPGSAALTILLAFLGLGLFLLALASIQDARRVQAARGEHDLPLARHWWGTVAAIVGALLVVALLLSRLFVPQTLSHLAAVAAAVLALLGRALAGLLLIVSAPIFQLLEWGMRLVGLRQGGGESSQITPPQSFAEQFGDLVQERGAHAPGMEAPLQIAGGVLVAALILVLFFLALRRFRTYLEDDIAETRESILSFDLLKAQLAQLLRRRAAADRSRPELYVVLTGGDPASQVRRTYQALLAWAAAAGISRPPGMTPDRYQQLLSDTYPQHREPLAVITAAYGLARYGAAPVSEERAAGVAAAWQQILEAAR